MITIPPLQSQYQPLFPPCSLSEGSQELRTAFLAEVDASISKHEELIVLAATSVSEKLSAWDLGALSDPFPLDQLYLAIVIPIRERSILGQAWQTAWNNAEIAVMDLADGNSEASEVAAAMESLSEKMYQLELRFEDIVSDCARLEIQTRLGN